MYKNLRLCVFSLMVVVALSGCSVLDCGNYKRMDNCFVFDAFSDSQMRKVSMASIKAENSFYKSYKPQEIKKPSRSWGD